MSVSDSDRLFSYSGIIFAMVLDKATHTTFCTTDIQSKKQLIEYSILEVGEWLKNKSDYELFNIFSKLTTQEDKTVKNTQLKMIQALTDYIIDGIKPEWFEVG